MNQYGVSLDSEQRSLFGRTSLVGTHRAHELDIFSDEKLAALLDNYPRQHVHVLTMGHDPERLEENLATVHKHLSGRELIDAIKRGRLWVNVKRVHEFDSDYGDVAAALYAEIEDLVPSFRIIDIKTSLLISSPRALVYAHVDGPPSLLWHVRGEKRVWTYPALDERFITREHLEDVHAGVAHEYINYKKELDQHATVRVLKPGEFAAWPHNAPHRITNLDSFNVSLNTEHMTRETRRRARVYSANRFFRVTLRWPWLSAKETGPVAFAKTVVHRGALALGHKKPRVKQHVATMRVDPNAPLGVAPLESAEQRPKPRKRRKARAANQV